MSNFENEIASLSTEQKFELIDVLWESLEAEATTITDEQQAELNYRVAKYERNPADVVPMGGSQGGSVKEAVTLPVVWLPEATRSLEKHWCEMSVSARNSHSDSLPQ